MKSVTREEILRGIALAERLVERETRIKIFRDKAEDLGENFRKHVLAIEEKNYAKAHKAVEDDMIAKEMLPQARTRLRIMAEREQFIETKTLLGKFVESVGDWSLFLNKAIRDVENPFADDPELSEAWDIFVGTKSQKKKAEALMRVLIAIKVDLEYTDLPPQPPPYIYKNKIYTKGEIN